tara:strand:- start:1426 stop:1563 length:138 start_codon:yes stop_codon:yes gene_type:complete
VNVRIVVNAVRKRLLIMLKFLFVMGVVVWLLWHWANDKGWLDERP